MKKTASVLLSLILTVSLTGTTVFRGDSSGIGVSASAHSVSQSTAGEQNNPFAKLDEARKANAARMVQKYSGNNTALEAQGTMQANEVVDAKNAKSFTVQFKDTVSYDEINNLISSYPYTMIGSSAIRTFTVKTDSEETLKAKLQGKCNYIEPNITLKQTATPNDPSFGSQWALTATNIPAAWDSAKGSSSVIVAMIDSGIDRTNEDLAKATILNGKDYLRSNSTVSRDVLGHGTSTTGVIAAVTNNSIGISGVCWNVTILPMQVFDTNGEASDSNVNSAIYDAADAGADIINLSLGGDGYTTTEQNAVNYAISKGCIVIASAGNDGNSGYNYPASLNGVISAGSVDSSLTYSYFSNYNDRVDVSAPGSNILTTAVKSTQGSYYRSVSGTSYSAPYVAGIAALARSCNDSITSDTFLKMIKFGSTDMGDPGYDVHYGYGVIDAQKIVALAKNPPSNWDYSYSVNGSTAQITGYAGTGGDITIPKTLGGYPVTSIGDSVFLSGSRLASLTIPSSVTSIGSNNFQNCSSLTSVDFGSGITSIGDNLFQNCPKLIGVVYPSNITAIGNNTFQGCGQLTAIVLPTKLQTIGDNSFRNCGLTGISFPLTLKTIGNSAFQYCNFKSVTIPNSVTSIGNYSFESCGELTDMAIGSGVTYIGTSFCSDNILQTAILVDANNKNYSSQDGVLFDKSKQQLVAFPMAKSGSYTIPGSVTGITAGVFQGRYFKLSSLTLPSSIVNIGANNFQTISGIASVVFGSGTTTIKDNLFQNCSGLTSVTFPSSLTTIGENTFQSCNLTSVTFPSGVTSIGKNSFTGCGSLTSVTFPTGLTSMADNTFSGCGLKSVTIPAGVKSIGNDCFQGCNSLANVTLPSGLTSIGEAAFQNTGLTNLIIPASVTTIGLNSFQYCSSLSNVTFLGTPAAIGTQCFSACSSLTKVTLGSGVSDIGFLYQDMFQYLSQIAVDSNNLLYSSLDGVLYNKTQTQLVRYPYANGTSGFSVPASVTSIGDYAFSNNPNLTQIAMSDNVTGIGKGAFQYCSKLANVTLPNGLTEISDRTFKSCFALTAIQIPSGVTKIGNSAFDTSGLRTLALPDSLTEIGDSAFTCCYYIKSVSFPQNLTKIGSYAFLGYTTSPYFQGNAPVMGSNVFVSGPIYYNSKKTGYTSPWYGYTTVAVDPVAAPVTVSQVSKSSTTIGISWSSVSGADGYFIYIDNIKFTTNPVSGTSYTVTGLKPNMTYNVTIKAEKYNIESPGTSMVASTDVFLFPAPVLFTVNSKTNTSVYLTWSSVSGAEGYVIYNGTTKITLNPVTTTAYTVTGLTQNTTYTFTVKSISTGFESSLGTSVTVTTDELKLMAPSGLTITSKTSDAVSLSWSPVMSALGYDVYVDGTKITTVPVNATSYTITGLSVDITYSITVKAVNSDVTSPASAPLTVTTATGAGNLNDDGGIDLVDVTLLSRYVAGWTVQVNTTALDVNGDGKVDLVDVTLLSRYVAGWNVFI